MYLQSKILNRTLKGDEHMGDMKSKYEQTKKFLDDLNSLPEAEQTAVINMVMSVATLERFKSQRSQKTA